MEIADQSVGREFKAIKYFNTPCHFQPVVDVWFLMPWQLNTSFRMQKQF